MATVKVFNAEGQEAGQLPLPKVFAAPIRNDVIQFAWKNMKRNTMAPYGVFRYAGVQHHAASWGPGRAVARVPRAHGGIGAYASMCRQGHMFNPTEVTRRWQRITPQKIKRYAVASAVAASAIPGLVEAHGHRVAEVKSLPLVLDISAQKTKEAASILAKVGAKKDVEASYESSGRRAGKGGHRNRRYVQKLGPLVIHAPNESTIALAFRNLPGVTVADVTKLNLLQLAPGGHPGRFIVWTKSAFQALDGIYESKQNFRLPVAPATHDFKKLNEQHASKIVHIHRAKEIKVDPFRCAKAMQRLNPAHGK